jgi:hypothetical protein
VIATDSDVWKQGNDMITDLFQPPRDDFFQHPHDDFWSCREGFDTFSFEHLDLINE